MNIKKYAFLNFPLRNKKGALELSVTAIVVLILAIVMLGLGLGFIRGMFGKVGAQVEQQITAEPEPPAPSALDPLTLSRENIITHAGDKEVIKVSIYNRGNETWTSIKPQLGCSIEITEQSANPKNIEQGKTQTFNLLVGIPSSPPNTYLCQMKLNPDKGYSRDFTIKIIE